MNTFDTLAKMPAGINGYSLIGSNRKAKMHSAGRAFLRRLAADLGLEKGSFDIRSNQGGIAVSGEVTLHGERIYVQLSEHCYGRRVGVSVLYRTCSGRKDYCGHLNHTTTMSEVAEDYENFVASLRCMVARLEVAA